MDSTKTLNRNRDATIRQRGTLISFASGPNHGKTTMAMRLFLHLTAKDMDTVLVQESIKQYVYSNREVEVNRPVLDDLANIKASIHRRAVVIYDSSLISPFCYRDEIKPSVEQVLKEFISCNLKHDIYIHIPEMSLPFNQSGRYQSNASECVEINHHFRERLDELSIPYINASFQDQDLLNTTIYNILLSRN